MKESITPQLSQADVAKLVKRPMAKLDKDGKPMMKDDKPMMDLLPVQANEVLSWKDYGDHVVVVTIDGKKFSGAKKS